MTQCRYECGRTAEAGKSRCRTCRRADRAQNPDHAGHGSATPVKVLLLDIETSPNLAHVWGLWDQNVGLSQLMEATEMLCFAAKWLGGRGTEFYSQHKDGREQMVAEAWNLLNEADVVMHFNGQKFDIPHLNREFVTAGMTPPSPYKQVDLLLAVRKQFRFPSNKLAYVSTALGLQGKEKHEGHELWVKCMAGDAGAWKRMEKYNRRDVVLLEELHAKLLPWIPTLPNALLYGGEGCPNCGSHDLQKRGYAYTNVSKFQQYLCHGCGSWFRGSRRVQGVELQKVAL